MILGSLHGLLAQTAQIKPAPTLTSNFHSLWFHIARVGLGFWPLVLKFIPYNHRSAWCKVIHHVPRKDPIHGCSERMQSAGTRYENKEKKNLSPVIVNCVFRVTLPRILQFQDLLEPVCIQNYCLYFYHYSFIDMSIFTAVPRWLYTWYMSRDLAEK